MRRDHNDHVNVPLGRTVDEFFDIIRVVPSPERVADVIEISSHPRFKFHGTPSNTHGQRRY